MFGHLAALDAEEIGGREAHLVARWRQAEERAVLRARPLGAHHHLVALRQDLDDLAAIVAEAGQHRGDELLPSVAALRQVGIVLDEVGRQEAIHRGRLALVHDFLDEAADELLVRLAIRRPGGGVARLARTVTAARAAVIGRRMMISCSGSSHATERRLATTNDVPVASRELNAREAAPPQPRSCRPAPGTMP